MVKISVWAPKAKQIELASQGRLTAMKKNEGGWWSLDDPLMKHGTDYAYHIDGEGPFPDPSSAWQPEGVLGPSKWVDHNNFTWTDSTWQQPPLSSAIFYELHVGTFTPQGTFDAVIGHLDYLVDLGITHVELMPVAEFSGNRGWGYDCVDLYAPHHIYGGPEGLKRLINACHEKGLAVILDVVYNHLGPVGNFLNRFGPYFTNRYSTPWGDAINMDGPASDEVRKFFIRNALMWLRDYHADGLRIDAVHAIIDTSAVHFLEQLASEVKHLEIELGRYLILIAESDLNDPKIIRSVELGGYGIGAQWNEDFHHALHAILTKEQERYYQDFGKLSDLAKALTKGLVYDGRYSNYRQRVHGRPATGLSAHKFIGFFQNHDQIGNRAFGERTCQLLSLDRVKIGAALVLMAPFVPMLFQGEEWGSSSPFLYFIDHQELGEAIYQGRKKEFTDFSTKTKEIPYPHAEDTFNQSKLHWDELKESPHVKILDWYRSLIRLRRQLPDLREDRLEKTLVTFEETYLWLVMKRENLLMVCNFADQSQRISYPDLIGKKILISSNDGSDCARARNRCKNEIQKIIILEII